MAISHGRFVWYELTTTDAPAARDFYAKVVGWGTRDASMPGAPYTFLTAGDVSIGGLMGLTDEARRMGAQSRWTGYVGVDDVDAATARLTQLGGAVYLPPTDVPGVSRFAIVADPQGATLALIKWLNAEAQAPGAPQTPGHIGWHDLFAADGQNVFAFYAALFGWQKVDSHIGPAAYHLFSVAGETIGGMSAKPPQSPVPFWLYYFNVENIDAATARVKAGGGQVLEGPVEVQPGNWIARCADPQGAMFALAGPGRSKNVGYFAPRPSAN
jgi:uncharacterized protein